MSTLGEMFPEGLESLNAAIAKLSEKPYNSNEIAVPLKYAANAVITRDPRLEGIIADVGKDQLAYMAAALFIGLLDRINDIAIANAQYPR